MNPSQTRFAGNAMPDEDERIFNILQIVFLAVVLALICGFAARSVGLGWSTTIALAWTSGIVGTLLVTFLMFVVNEAVSQHSHDAFYMDDPDEIKAMIDEWDQDLASDDLANGTALWFGDRSVLRKAASEAAAQAEEQAA